MRRSPCGANFFTALRRPTSLSPLFATVQTLAQAIRQQHITPLVVVEAQLAHIRAHNPTLNAIITLAAESAQARAQAATEALARGESWGPLHGVPFTLEDAHPTQGVRSTWGGYPPLLPYTPSRDGTVAARLKAAGGILLGKTNGPVTWQRSPFGLSANPWQLDHTPGGTASGPAVAVAAGLSPLDVGLDTTGSVLNPAHYCGVCAMRPTEGRIPLTGMFFKDPIHKFRAFSVAAPVARCVADLELALSVLVGPDGHDATVAPVPWRAIPPAPDLAHLRVAYAPALPGFAVDADHTQAVENLVQQLTTAGAKVSPAWPQIDFAAHVTLTQELYQLMDTAFARPTDTPPATLENFLQLLHQRAEFMAKWEGFLADWDVWVVPAGSSAAHRIDEPFPAAGFLYYTLSTLSGCPAVSLPLGLTAAGLPIHVQILARRWADETLLAIARQIEALAGGFRSPPAYGIPAL